MRMGSLTGYSVGGCNAWVQRSQVRGVEWAPPLDSSYLLSALSPRVTGNIHFVSSFFSRALGPPGRGLPSLDTGTAGISGSGPCEPELLVLYVTSFLGEEILHISDCLLYTQAPIHFSGWLVMWMQDWEITSDLQ